MVWRHPIGGQLPGPAVIAELDRAHHDSGYQPEQNRQVKESCGGSQGKRHIIQLPDRDEA